MKTENDRTGGRRQTAGHGQEALKPAGIREIVIPNRPAYLHRSGM